MPPKRRTHANLVAAFRFKLDIDLRDFIFGCPRQARHRHAAARTKAAHFARFPRGWQRGKKVDDVAGQRSRFERVVLRDV